MAKQSYTKADYEGAARSLATSVVIQIGTTNQVEEWIAHREAIAQEFGYRDWHLSAELLRDAWARERERREERGECVDCGSGSDHHARLCPRYRSPYLAAPEATEAAETLERR